MAKQVKDEVPNAHFIIVGNGNQEDEIRRYAKDNGFSDSLHITGWVDDPMSYVELFDVACLLSRWEGFGLALPEYMMASKPIVASRVDAMEKLKAVDGKCLIECAGVEFMSFIEDAYRCLRRGER